MWIGVDGHIQQSEIWNVMDQLMNYKRNDGLAWMLLDKGIIPLRLGPNI